MEKNLRVLMIGPDRKAKGGIASVVNQYYSAGLNNRIKLSYLATTVDGNAIIKLIYYVYAVMVFFFRVHGYDILHVHMSSGNSYRRKKLLINAARLFGKKVIIHLHSGAFDKFYLGMSRDGKTKVRKTFLRSDRVIVLSEEWKDRLVGLLGKKIEGKTTVLKNAVTMPDFERTDFSSIDMVFLGNVCEEKGVGVIIDALKIFKDRLGDFGLPLNVAVCGGGETEQFEKKCSELGIPENVSFLGWVDGETKEKLLKERSIFLLPSYYEGLPMSMLEAMSYGMNVIVSNVGGIPSVIKHMENGILVQPGDPEAVADAMETVLFNWDLHLSMSKNAYNTIKNDFNIKKNIEKLIGIYVQLAR